MLSFLMIRCGRRFNSVFKYLSNSLASDNTALEYFPFPFFPRNIPPMKPPPDDDLDFCGVGTGFGSSYVGADGAVAG